MLKKALQKYMQEIFFEKKFGGGGGYVFKKMLDQWFGSAPFTRWSQPRV